MCALPKRTWLRGWLRGWMLVCLWAGLFAPFGLRADSELPYTYTTRQLEVAFNHQGALISALACFPDCQSAGASRVRLAGQVIVQPLTAGTGELRARWSAKSRFDQTHQILTLESPRGATLDWRIPLEGYLISLTASGMEGLQMISPLSFRPAPAAGFGNWLEQVRYVVIDDNGAANYSLRDEDINTLDSGGSSAPVWAGFRNRYWALLATAGGSAAIAADVSGASDQASISVKPIVASGEWQLYLGPLEPRVLNKTEAGLSGLMWSGLWFWLRWICFGLFYLLDFIHRLVPAWGLAIMLLSVSVNLLMRPLSRIADRLQQQVHEIESRLAPHIAKIKREHRGEAQASKITDLFREHGVHPLYSLKSLAGIAVVIPVFIGAFDMLAENIHLQHAAFAWIEDLSRPDGVWKLPWTIPFFGSSLNLLPLIMSVLSIWASVLHQPVALDASLRRRQSGNMLLLAAAFFVLFYTFPAGMVLYWTTNNLISVAKSLRQHYHRGRQTDEGSS